MLDDNDSMPMFTMYHFQFDCMLTFAFICVIFCVNRTHIFESKSLKVSFCPVVIPLVYAPVLTKICSESVV